jgi:NAD-dependent dihydropyrimidine dehydrogenase PreA subunit
MAYKWLPVVDAERCTGCGLCVDACGPRSLEMTNGIPTLVLADTCGSEEHCIAVCRDDAIGMAWLAFDGTLSVGEWSDTVAAEGPARAVRS